MVHVAIPHKMRGFIDSLQPPMMSILLFDQARHIVGFAVLDRNDRTRRAMLYNVDCKEIREVIRDTTIKEMVDILLQDKCTYTA